MDMDVSSSIEDEKELVERLLLRLAMADSDAQVQSFVTRHLVTAICAAAKPHLLVQVRELLTLLNRRVKTNMEIMFPIENLLALVRDDVTSPVVLSLALVYLRFSRDRLSNEEQIDYLPIYLEALNNKTNNKELCFDLLSLCMPAWTAISKKSQHEWPVLPEFSLPLKSALYDYFRAVLSFQKRNQEHMTTVVADLTSMTEKSYEEWKGLTQSGIARNEYLALASKLFPGDTRTCAVKVAVVRVLSGGVLSEVDCLPLFIYAQASEMDEVDFAAEAALKKIEITKCVDDATVVSRLFFAIFGTAVTKDAPANPGWHVGEGSSLLKSKVLPMLLRSNKAHLTYMNCIKTGMLSFGIAHPQLRVLLLRFLHRVIGAMPPPARNGFGKPIFLSLLQNVNNPQVHPEVLEWSLHCLGAMGSGLPSLVLAEINIYNLIFDIIYQNEVEGVQCAAADCLLSWLSIYRLSDDEKEITDRIPTNVIEQLKNFIALYVKSICFPGYTEIQKGQRSLLTLFKKRLVAVSRESDNGKCRMVALKYIEVLLSTDEMTLRWLLLRSAGDSREDMRAEAARLLELSFNKRCPEFQSALKMIWSEVGGNIVDETGTEKASRGDEFSHLTHEMCARYLWALLEKETGGTPQLRFVEGDSHWMSASPRVVSLLQSKSPDVVHKFCTLALFAIKHSHDVHQFRVAASALTAQTLRGSFRVFPSVLTSAIDRAHRSSRFELASTAAYLAAMSMENDHVRLEAAQKAYQVICDNGPVGECWMGAACVSLCDSLEKSVEEATRLVLAMSRLAAQGYDRPSSALEHSLGALAMVFQHFHAGTKELLLKEEELDEILSLCVKVAASRKDSIAMKAREAAVAALGLAVGNMNSDLLIKVEKELDVIGDGPPQAELQLSVGEALWDAVYGPHSPSRRQPFRLELHQVQLSDEDAKSACNQRLWTALSSILDSRLGSGNHNARRAGLIWLMVIVQKASVLGSEGVIASLDRIQSAFAEGLTENDEFIQDVASKGMGIVYQMASADQKKELVAGLMGTLSEGKKEAPKFQKDSVVFEGQLGKSPTGENLNTYKELCALATDLNQPDLVYRFMQLAKHNATWNAKKGAAFGFGVVLEQAREELDPYIGQLVPKLFRYRYDPDTKVQQAMRSIWTVLTQTKRNVYADDVARELIPCLTNREWRVRESACLALADLLSAHDTAYMHSRLPELYDTVLRVRDDIKESVRLGADKAASALKRVVVRLASGDRARSQAFLADFLPVVIEKGVYSSIATNKAFSLALLMELAKEAGAQLRPYLPTLIPTLLDSISDSENSVLNYIATRSSNQQLEALDDARSQLARTSPMMASIYDVLPHIDNEVLVGVQPRLCEQLKGSVGVSTRAAAAQLIATLAVRAPTLLIDNQPMADKLFGALVPGARDRNPSLRKQMASTISYLAKFVSHQPLNVLFRNIANDLLSDNQEMKSTGRQVLKCMVQRCPELVEGYATRIVPYVFLETCQQVIKGDAESKKKHDDWMELWTELVPSTESAVRLYKKEIVELAMETLSKNDVWIVRAQAARMLARAVRTLAEGLEAQEALTLLNALIPMLSGRIWKGKEEVLDAVAAVVTAAGDRLKGSWSEEQRTEIETVLRREGSKKNRDYSSAGLRACAAYATAMKSHVMAAFVSDQTNSITNALLHPSEDGVSCSDDEGQSSVDKERRIALLLSHYFISAAHALRAYSDGADCAASLCRVAGYVENVDVYWKARQDLVAELLETVTKWDVGKAVDSSSLVRSLLTMAEEMCSHQRKSIAAQAIQVIMKIAERRTEFAVNWEEMSRLFEEGSAVSDTGMAERLKTAIRGE